MSEQHPTEVIHSASCCPSVTDGQHHQLEIRVELGTEYEPDKISVKASEHKIYVTAKKEEHQDNRTFIRTVAREYDLPPMVSAKTVKAKLKRNGILVLTAPLKEE